MRWFFDGEHPITAVLAVVAIVAAILLIMWARIAVHGTGDLEAALEEPSAAAAQPPRHVDSRTEEQREVDAAVTSNRFATGFSP